MISPRAIPVEQLAKEVAAMGWLNMSTEMKQLGHAWVDVNPLLESEGADTLIHVGVLKEAGDGGGKIPWSAAHLEMLRRLGVEVNTGTCDVAGRAEPALRVAKKA